MNSGDFVSGLVYEHLYFVNTFSVGAYPLVSQRTLYSDSDMYKLYVGYLSAMKTAIIYDIQDSALKI